MKSHDIQKEKCLQVLKEIQHYIEINNIGNFHIIEDNKELTFDNGKFSVPVSAEDIRKIERINFLCNKFNIMQIQYENSIEFNLQSVGCISNNKYIFMGMRVIISQILFRYHNSAEIFESSDEIIEKIEKVINFMSKTLDDILKFMEVANTVYDKFEDKIVNVHYIIMELYRCIELPIVFTIDGGYKLYLRACIDGSYRASIQYESGNNAPDKIIEDILKVIK